MQHSRRRTWHRADSKLYSSAVQLELKAARCLLSKNTLRVKSRVIFMLWFTKNCKKLPMHALFLKNFWNFWKEGEMGSQYIRWIPRCLLSLLQCFCEKRFHLFWVVSSVRRDSVTARQTVPQAAHFSLKFELLRKQVATYSCSDRWFGLLLSWLIFAIEVMPLRWIQPLCCY